MNSAMAALGLAMAGLISSIYFALAHYGRIKTGDMIPTVAGEGICVSILDTPYARVLGLPNSVFGITYYLLITFSAGYRLLFGEWLLLNVLIVVAVLAALFSLFLAWSLIFRIRVFCPVCFLSHAVNLALAVILLLAV